MDRIRATAERRPLLVAMGFLILWPGLVVLFTNLIPTAMGLSGAEPLVAAAGLLAATAVVLGIAAALGLLRPSGITRLGNLPPWLLALVATFFIVTSTLFAATITGVFDDTGLLPLGAGDVLLALAVALGEEIVFRGLVLTNLRRVWGRGRAGLVGVVVMTAAVSAVLHQSPFTFAIQRTAALQLMAAAFLLALFWGALAVLSGSVWPGAAHHFVVNSAVALPAITVATLSPEAPAFGFILLLSVPLGVIGLLLLAVLAPVTPAETAEQLSL